MAINSIAFLAETPTISVQTPDPFATGASTVPAGSDQTTFSSMISSAISAEDNALTAAYTAADAVVTAAYQAAIIAAAMGQGPGGRLTLASATPIMTATQSAKTAVLYTPHRGLLLPSYNGSVTRMVNYGGELTFNLDSNAANTGYHQSGKNFDIFWDDAGARLVSGPAWTSDTAQAITLAYVNGWLTNAAPMTAKFDLTSATATIATGRGLYLGTMRASANGQTQFVFGGRAAGGTAGSFLLWNAYHRSRVLTTVQDSTTSWTYTTSTIRAARGSATARVSYIEGISNDGVLATYSIRADASGGYSSWGIGLDSTSAFASPSVVASISGGQDMGDGRYCGYPGAGFHFVSACEYSGGGSGIWYGSDITAGSSQSGLIVELMM